MDKNSEIIEALAKNEANVAELYRKYGERFPEYKEFWNSLAAEEIGHADKLRSLSKVSTEYNLNIRSRFNITAIQNFSKHVLTEINHSRLENSSIINALSVALYIEQSLIEHKYFEVFDSDSIAIKQVLSSLAEDTNRHMETVRRLWAKHSHQT
jgi:rubrerythrin